MLRSMKGFNMVELTFGDLKERVVTRDEFTIQQARDVLKDEIFVKLPRHGDPAIDARFSHGRQKQGVDAFDVQLGPNSSPFFQGERLRFSEGCDG